MADTSVVYADAVALGIEGTQAALDNLEVCGDAPEARAVCYSLMLIAGALQSVAAAIREQTAAQEALMRPVAWRDIAEGEVPGYAKTPGKSIAELTDEEIAELSRLAERAS